MLKDIERGDTYIIQKLYTLVKCDIVNDFGKIIRGSETFEKTFGYQIVPIREGKVLYNTHLITRHQSLSGARAIARGEKPVVSSSKRSKVESMARKEVKRQESRELRQKMQSSGKR
jgi:predicted component of viral defense system (DUF524 family)